MAHGVSMFANGKASLVAMNGGVWHNWFQAGEGLEGKVIPWLTAIGNGEIPKYTEETLYIQGPGGIMTPVPDRKAIRCSTTGAITAFVSGRYRFEQPLESFRVLDWIIESGQGTLETMGMLFDGRKIFALVKVNREAGYICGDDMFHKYLLISDSFDGQGAKIFALVLERVVCANTLKVALSEKTAKLFRISHRGDVKGKSALASEAMGLVDKEISNHLASLELLERIPMSIDEAAKYYRKVLNPAKAKAKALAKVDNSEHNLSIDVLSELNRERGAESIDDILEHTLAQARGDVDEEKLSRTEEEHVELFRTGGFNGSINRTVGGALNGVTEHASRHGQQRGAVARTESIGFGHLGRRIELAHEIALSYIK